MRWKDVRHTILLFLVPTLGAALLRLLLASLRIRVVGQENLDAVNEAGKGSIFVFWHSRMLYMLVAKRSDWRVHTMVSRNRDGEYIARVAARFGRPTVRGSTSRGGGAALMTLARILESGDSVAFTPDGPRGPREVFQPGAVRLSQMTGRPVVPSAYSVNRKKVFASWDGFVLPYPFAKGVLVIGRPIWPSEFPDGKQGLESMRQAAEQALRETTANADALATRTDSAAFPRPKRS